MERQDRVCGLCGHRFPGRETVGSDILAGFAPEFDHIVPRARGGTDELHNLRLVHHACNQLRGDGDSLQREPPIPRSLRIPAPPLPPRVRINAQGEAWCRNRDAKRVYRSLNDAWAGALRTFLQTGRIYTPYHCGRSVYSYAIVKRRLHPNPWAFDPWIVWVGSISHKSHGCGMWHLTSSARHTLPHEKRPALPKAMGWEAYHRATDGMWVRKDRECIRRDGLPKKQFATREEADRYARSMSVADGKRGRRYRSYMCSSGHVHIGADRD